MAIKWRPANGGQVKRTRDQQKWDPVLRPIALSDIKRAHDLVAKPLTLLADHAPVIPETFR